MMIYDRILYDFDKPCFGKINSTYRIIKGSIIEKWITYCHIDVRRCR